MKTRTWLALLAAPIGFACGSDVVEVAGNVAVSVATQAPQTVSPAVAFSKTATLDDTIVSGVDTIIVTRARIVLREIELKRVEIPDCPSNQGPGNCEEVELGPVLVELPLEQGAQRKFNVQIPSGTYNEIELEVHKPDDGDPDDQVFIQQNPDFADISIRVEGAFNGTSFVYDSDLDVEQELNLQPPLVVDAQTVTNVTVFVDIDRWFRRADGTVVDPATANKDGENENLVKDNIIASFRAFEDRDEDGDDRDG
jgi:hypothetical protein